jgi:hypothetical protein
VNANAADDVAPVTNTPTVNNCICYYTIELTIMMSLDLVSYDGLTTGEQVEVVEA